jgi:hypothetical protein
MGGYRFTLARGAIFFIGGVICPGFLRKEQTLEFR